MNNYLFLFFRYKWSDNNPLSEQNIKKKSIKAKNIDSACKKMLNYIEKSDANLGFRIDQEVEVNEKIIDISGNLSLEKYF